MSDGVRFEVLGDVRISRDGVALATALPRKGLALLAYLALTGRPQPRERLAALLWGESSQEAARGSLRKALTLLRERLGPLFIATRTLVSLDPAQPFWCDALVLEAALRDPHDEPALSEALALYTGEFLADLVLPEAEPFDDWAARQRARLHTLAAEAARSVARQRAARGAHTDAIAILRQLIDRDPWDDEAHRLLVATLVATGQPGRAHTHHAAYQQHLVVELGVDPDAVPPFHDQPHTSPERRATPLPATERDGGSATPGTPQRAATLPRRRATDLPPGMTALPADPTPFIGRTIELAAVLALFDEGARLVTLTGLGGSGKTRLGLAAARAVAERGEAVAFVTLAPLTEPSALAATIATTLNLLLRDGDAERTLLRALHTQSLFLILDNFEHLHAAATFVSTLLAAAPLLRILVTSREPLQLRGEYRYDVRGLALAQDMTLAAAREAAAVQLFVAGAVRARADFTLDAATLPGVLRLCALVAGLPLGLELAAAQLDLLTPDAIAAELVRSTDALTVEWRDIPERHRSLRAVFDWSWRLLSDGERQALRRSALFRGGLTRDAATAVAGATARDLAALVRKSLLQRSAGCAGEERYEIHELVRQFAAEQLDLWPAERAMVEARHGAYFLTQAEEAAAELLGPQQAHWIRQLDRERDNLRATLAWTERHAPVDDSLRLVGALGRYWVIRGHLGEARSWIERAEARAGSEAAPSGIRAKALYALGLVTSLQNDLPMGEHYLTASIALFEESGDPVGAVRAFTTLAGVAYDRADLASAVSLLSRSLVMARQAGDLGEVARVLNNLGDALYLLGDYAMAERHTTEALHFARSSGHIGLEATVIGNLGNVAARQGQLVRALDLHREALVAQWQSGDQRMIACALENLAGTVAQTADGAAVARLLGAAAALRTIIAIPQPLPEQQNTARVTAPARAALGEEAWERAFASGQTAPLETVITPMLAPLASP